MEAGAGQSRQVEITSRRDPQHRAGPASQHGSGEQRRGGAVLHGRAAGEQFVHCAQGEAPAEQVRVQRWQAERQARERRIGAGPALKGRDLCAQARHDLRPHELHASLPSRHTDLNVS